MAATQAGVILGTAAYMARSRLAGKVDKRADIWAFGVVLYEMLTGRRALPRDTARRARQNRCGSRSLRPRKSTSETTLWFPPDGRARGLCGQVSGPAHPLVGSLARLARSQAARGH